MPGPKSLEKRDIEVTRQLLVEALYSQLPEDRYWKRDAIKQLLSTLIACRERGMAFEKIAEIFKKGGIAIEVDTLRNYFFDVKTQAELAAESARHAQKLAATREAIQKQVEAIHQKHGDAVGEKRARLRQATPQVFTVGDDVDVGLPDGQHQSTQTERRAPDTVKEKPISKTEIARPASPAAPVPPPAAEEPARFESEGAVPEPVASVKPASTLPTSEKANRATPDVQSEGPMTLADIERASQATEERTELLGDVELRGELVYYVSGQPFHGLLSQRQIRLLRTVGRIIAPTKGRTSKDFVAMPTKL